MKGYMMSYGRQRFVKVVTLTSTHNQMDDNDLTIGLW